MDIRKIIKQLTLKEKAALLSGVTNWQTTPLSVHNVKTTMMADGPTGLRKETKSESFLAPSYPATCFPSAVTQASTWNLSLIEKLGNTIAEEALDQEVDTVLGPGVNIKRDPRCGRNFEYFSEDPLLSGLMGAAIIDGIQAKGVGTSIKHFALNNQELYRMNISSEATLRVIHEIYLKPFEIAIKKSKPTTIMAAYNQVNGVHATQNKWLLTDVLRKKWKYEGLVVSDWGAVVDRVAALKAGLDLEMPSSNGINDQLIIDAVNNGDLAIEDVDKAVNNVLQYVHNRIKNRPKKKTKYDYEKGHQVAYEVAIEGAVLLKNEPQVLPLKQHQSIAVIGHMAKYPRYQGSGSSRVNPTKLISFIDVLDEHQVAYEFADINLKSSYQNIKDAARLANGKDAVLLFVGLDDEEESEGFDRRHLSINKKYLRLIDFVLKNNPNVVIVLSIGGPILMPFVDKVPAILNMYLSGQASGQAAYDLLFGKVSPSGKLAETFPIKEADMPTFGYFPMGPQQVVYQEGIYVGYRHYEKAKKEVLFPFGHGLSYTQFRYRNLLIENNLFNQDSLKLSLEVTNVGNMEGQEVVQFYIKEMQPIIDRPDMELKAFSKVHLKPGETKIVSVTLNQQAFEFFDERFNNFNIATGDFKILVGSSVKDIWLREFIYVEPKAVPLLDPKANLITKPKHPVAENYRYTRKNVDKNATFFEIKKISLIGYIIYRLIKPIIRKQAGKQADKATKAMVEKTALFMPIRQIANFSGGLLTQQGIDGILLMVQGRLFKGLSLLKKDMKNQKTFVAKTIKFPIND